MTMRQVTVGAWLSAGMIVLAGCSSDAVSPSPAGDSGVPGSGGAGGSAGGSSAGGKTGSGGKASSGGASAGGASAGGASAGGATTGTGGAGTGGHASDAGPDGAGASDAGTGDSGTGGADAGALGAGGTGAGGASPTDAGTDAGAAGKRVFVTSGTTNGDLKTAGSGTSGLDGADKLCQAAASALGGSWVAWLSDSSTDAIDRIADVGPWYRVDGVKVFESKAALTGNPLAPINLSESGGTVNVLPWTGTKADGTKNAATCADWTSAAAGNGMCGSSSSATGAWTESSALPCQIPYNLYCFEQ